MRHPTSRVLFAYWDHLRGTRSAPERGEIEPGSIRHVLADTVILDLDEPDEPRVRLAGTRLCGLFGRELKGDDFTALWSEAGRDEIRRLIGAVQDDAAGIVGGLVGQTADGDRVTLEVVLLPLRHHGRTHSRVLGAISPGAVPVWLGLKPVVSLETISLRIIWPLGDAAPAAAPPAEERRRRLVVHQGGRA